MSKNRGRHRPCDQLGTLQPVNDRPTQNERRSSDQSDKVEEKAKVELPNLAPDPDITRQTGDMRLYGYYFSAMSVPFATLFFLFLCITILASEFQSIWLKWWSEDEERSPSQHTWTFVGGFLGIGMASELGIIASLTSMMVFAVPRASEIIHRRLLKAVFGAPYQFFTSVDSGITVNRFSQDISLVDMELPTGLLQALDGLIASIISAVLIFIVSKYMAILVPFILVLLYYIQKFYLRTSRQIRFLDLEAKSPLYTNFLETVSGLGTIKAFKWEDAWINKNLGHLDDSQRPFYLLYCIQRWLNLVMDMVVAVIAVCVVAIATQLPHRTSGGYLGLALSRVLDFSQMLAYLIISWTKLETSLGAISRIRGFEKSTPPEDDLAASYTEPTATWPERGEVVFENVIARYRYVFISSNIRTH